MKKLMAEYFDKERLLFVVYIKDTEKSIPTDCQCRDDFSDWTNCFYIEQHICAGKDFIVVNTDHTNYDNQRLFGRH